MPDTYYTLFLADSGLTLTLSLLRKPASRYKILTCPKLYFESN